MQGLPAGEDPRFAEHLRLPLIADDGNTTFLIAWIGLQPVGHLNLKWNGDKEPQVRAHVADTPELNGISVWPPDMQSQGIGTSLITAAEAMIRDRGYVQVGLGVEISNQRAQRLYERLGYRDWGLGTYHDRWVEVDDDGREISHDDPCIYLLKSLA